MDLMILAMLTAEEVMYRLQCRRFAPETYAERVESGRW